MNKDVILFVNAIRPQTMAALERFKQMTGRTFTPVIIVDEKIKESVFNRNQQHSIPEEIVRLAVDFDSAKSIRHALKPYMDRIFAVTSQYENSVLELKKLTPYLPHLPMPTEKSLEWATEKKLMRELLESYNPALVPGYIEVVDSKDSTINDIEAMLSYPMIIKPSGLEGSLLVTRVENREELTSVLKLTLREVQKAYNKWIKRQAPILLVEEFMEGDMYSIDTYVAADGTCHHTPLVEVVTGRKVGFDDFFGYKIHTLTDLREEEIAAARNVAEQACAAVGLRSVTAHIELMKTTEGWKIVELGPRIGGYRQDLYSRAFGINHIMNDVLNRGGETPIIPKETLSHAAYFHMYADKEGIVTAIDGIDIVKQLPSFVSLTHDVVIGEFAYFAKHNGDPVINVILNNSDKEQLLSDIATMEDVIKIHIESESAPAKKLAMAHSDN